MFFAGIMGYGCNIGHRKLGRISRNINADQLTNIVNWYFSLDNVTKANDKILSLMDKLNLPKIYARKRGEMHTGSDGLKCDIHSTDTHGYSEIIFGVTHLIGVSFAPRVKSFKDQQMYGFESPSFYKSKGYKICPNN